MKASSALVLAIALAATAGCSTVRRSGTAEAGELDRAALLRCGLPEPGTRPDTAGPGTLAGNYRLHMTGPGATRAAGELVLGIPDPALASRPPGEAEPGEVPAGAAPRLVGSAEIDADVVGAIVPGELASADPEAPGAALYAFPSTPSTAADSAGWRLVIRLGSESNDRRRQRFDGAHTTLRLDAVGSDRFGGEWTSALGATQTGGRFCAVRKPSGESSRR